MDISVINNIGNVIIPEGNMEGIPISHQSNCSNEGDRQNVRQNGGMPFPPIFYWHLFFLDVFLVSLLDF